MKYIYKLTNVYIFSILFFLYSRWAFIIHEVRLFFEIIKHWISSTNSEINIDQIKILIRYLKL